MGNHRILIVDDNRTLSEFLGIVIKNICSNCQLVVFSDSVAALAQVQNLSDSQSFDLIFTDYDMPTMNGLDLAHAVFKIYPKTKVVLMTGHTNIAGLNSNDRPSNFAGLLRKPFRKEEVEQTLKAALENSK